MSQIEYNLKLIRSGAFTETNKTIEIPSNKVWEILGFRFAILPNLVGTRLVRFDVEVEGNIIFEAFAPLLEITEQFVTSGSFSVITGLRGVVSQTLMPGVFTGAHAIFQLPDRVVLPRNSRIKTTITANPPTSDEIKRIYILVDQSKDIEAI